MKVVHAEFVTSAPGPEQYPEPGLPEVAFAGRSNVGKSTLINRLVNRRNLVKTSSTPGRTQLINFFAVNHRVMFVDLPGYGYARVPAAVRRQWGPMVERYLSSRRNLTGVVLLLDARRKPNEEDLRMARWLSHYRLPAVYVLTKADKLSHSAGRVQQKTIASAFELDPTEPILFSARSRKGLETTWQAIEALIAPGLLSTAEKLP